MTDTRHSDFVFQTMLTCIGNKRKLVGNIREIAESIREKLGKEKLCIMDGFTGSGVVARELVSMCHTIITNDLEPYAYLMSKCFLETPTPEQQHRIAHHIQYMNRLSTEGPFIDTGIIAKLYAPKNTQDIQPGERCFYTRENAVIIDTMRRYISDNVEPELQLYCLVPLLIKASIHTNTAGVFKGFYKDGDIGCFGGAGHNALSRIMKPITVDLPIWLPTPHRAICHNVNTNTLIVSIPELGTSAEIGSFSGEQLSEREQERGQEFHRIKETMDDVAIDILYLDPPYNQHPYGSNYFMLNVIAKNEEPAKVSKVSGIPTDWNKSAYNSNASAVRDMEHLLRVGLEKARYIVLSYNDEGIISPEEWGRIFAPYSVEKREILYDTFKGSRNLRERSNKVVEIMYIITKKNGTMQ